MMQQPVTQRMHDAVDIYDAPKAASKAAQFFKKRAGRKAANQEAYQHWRDRHRHALLTTNVLNLFPPPSCDVEASIKVARFFNEPGSKDLPLQVTIPMNSKLVSQKAPHPKAPPPSSPPEAPSWPGSSAWSAMSTAMPEDISSSAEDVPVSELVKTSSRSQPHQPVQASAFAKAPPLCPGGAAVADGTASSSTDHFSYWS